MIGWMVASNSASGWRRMCSSPRRAITQLSRASVERRGAITTALMSIPPRSRPHRSAPGRHRPGWVGAGQVLHCDAVQGQQRGQLGDRRGTTGDRRSHRSAASSTCATDGLTRATAAMARERSAGSATTTWIWSPPTDASGCANHRARSPGRGRHDDSSASRSASSRYCVVSRIVEPPVTNFSSRSHNSSRARGSSPVVGSSRNSTCGGRPAWRPGQPPTHATGVVLGTLLRGVVQRDWPNSSPRPGLGRTPAQVVQLADHHQVLVAGELAVHGGVLRGQTERRAHPDRVGGHIDAGHRACPHRQQ